MARASTRCAETPVSNAGLSVAQSQTALASARSDTGASQTLFDDCFDNFSFAIRHARCKLDIHRCRLDALFDDEPFDGQALVGFAESVTDGGGATSIRFNSDEPWKCCTPVGNIRLVMSSAFSFPGRIFQAALCAR